MQRSRRIVLNTVSNIVLQCVSVGVSFVMMPLVLRYFGKEVFGINAYVAGIVLLFTFISSAISMSLMKFIPESLASGDYETFNGHVSTTLSVSLMVNVLVGGLIWAFPIYGVRLFDVPAHLQEVTRAVFAVLGIATMLKFPVPVINGIYYGLERFFVINCIQLIAVVAPVVAYCFVVSNQGSLAQYIGIVQCGSILVMVLSILMVFALLPCKLKWRPPTLVSLKRMFAFNLYLISNQAADTLLYSADKMILQKLMGVTAVADYHIARRTQSMAHAAISLPLSAIIPSLSAAYASGDTRYISRMNRVGTFLYAAFLVPPLATLFCLYDSFIQLWIGGDVAHIVLPGRLFLLTVIMALPFKVFSHCLVAHGRVRELGIAKVSYALLNIPLSIILASRIGLVGVVIPTVCYWLVVYPLVVGALAVPQQVGRGILSSFGLATCAVAMAWLARTCLFTTLSTSWLGFAARAVAVFVAFAVLYAGVALVWFLADIRELLGVRRQGGSGANA